MKSKLAFAALLLALTGFAPVRIQAQTTRNQEQPGMIPPDPNGPPPTNETLSPFEREVHEMEAKNRKLESERTRQEVQADSNKLLTLAQELNSEISRSGRTSLSSDEAKKFAEIGKLAHKVRTEMANYARGF